MPGQPEMGSVLRMFSKSNVPVRSSKELLCAEDSAPLGGWWLVDAMKRN
jgi:hypothetical protein